MVWLCVVTDEMWSEKNEIIEKKVEKCHASEKRGQVGEQYNKEIDAYF